MKGNADFRAGGMVLASVMLMVLVSGCTAHSDRLPSHAPIAPPDPAMAAADAGQEIWIIAVDEDTEVALRGEAGASSGLIRLEDGREEELIAQAVRVHAELAAEQATVAVDQRYENPHDQAGEVIYAFVLPADARVNDFILTVQGRQIRGVIRPREQAEALYEQARRQGYRASLVRSQQQGIFTQRLSRLRAGESLDVRMQYRQPVEISEDRQCFTLPAALVEAARRTTDRRSLSIALSHEAVDLQLTNSPHRLDGAHVNAPNNSPRRYTLTFDRDAPADNLRLSYRVDPRRATADDAPNRDGLGDDQGLITIDASDPDD